MRTDIQRIVGQNDYVPQDAAELCKYFPYLMIVSRLLHTCYMGTEHSGVESRERAKHLANTIGSYHLDISIQSVVQALQTLFTAVTGKVPQFQAYGGSRTQDLALQNMQSRSRMVISYMFAQLLMWTRGRDGSLLVLASSNVDES